MTVIARDLPVTAVEIVAPQTPCAACPHIRAFHAGGVNCRACRCEQFRAAGSPIEEEPPPRRVVFDIPDGFSATVTLTPIAVPDGD